VYYFSIASEYGNLFTSCQKAKRTLSKGSFECKQAAKSMWTLNSTMSQPRDSTAYVRVCNPITRKRSLSTSMLTHTKGDSITFPVAEAVYSNNVSVREVKPLKVAKQVDVTSIVRKQLDQVKNPGASRQKYYKIINLIANPQFLAACYVDIIGKEVNNAATCTPDWKGLVNKIILDGVAPYHELVKIAQKLKKGTFSPASKCEAGAVLPHNQIVQKALYAVLEAIYEPLFLPSCHGFMPLPAEGWW
jgi:hypothetical protein